MDNLQPEFRTPAMVFYSPGAQFFLAVAVLDNGEYVSQANRKTLAEYQLKHPAVQVMRMSEAMKQMRDLHREPVSEITKSRYWELLEVVPPYRQAGNIGSVSFVHGEPFSLGIRIICCQICFKDSDDRYFMFRDLEDMPHNEIDARCREFIASH